MQARLPAHAVQKSQLPPPPLTITQRAGWVRGWQAGGRVWAGVHVLFFFFLFCGLGIFQCPKNAWGVQMTGSTPYIRVPPCQMPMGQVGREKGWQVVGARAKRVS